MAKRKRKNRGRQAAWTVLMALAAVGAVTLIYLVIKLIGMAPVFNKKETVKIVEERPEMTVDLLTPNEYSRPQTATEKINGIVIHYTANPGTSAKQNRDYFDGLKDSHKTKASSHFVIGIEGEIIQCIPTAEMSYASNERNNDTVSIECCHVDESGRFTEETYDSLIKLTAYLCGKFHLDPSNDVIRHYDITGKACPKYYVDNPKEWEKLKKDVEKYIDAYGTEVNP